MEGKVFVIAIIAICTIGWVINNYIRARHGYALEDEWGGKTEKTGQLDSERKLALISQENTELKGKIVRLEDRLAVIERIVTDKSHRLAEEIESLR